MATKTIKGMDELVRKLDTFAKLKGAKRGLKAGAVHVMGTIKPYPPLTLRKRSGTVGGRKTSETLGRRWTTRGRDAGLTQLIGNNASYAPYVHDEEEQAGFHGRRGWKTDEQVLKSEGDEVLQFIQREVEKELAR
jgi:hypothetical protein